MIISSPKEARNVTAHNHKDSSSSWPQRTRWSLWQSSSIALWTEDNLQEGQPFLQHSTSQACMVEGPDGSHSSVKGTWQPAWSLPKCTWKTLRLWEIKFSGLIKQRLNSLAWMQSVMSGGNQALVITCLIPSLQWSMVVTALCCGDVFQQQELGD